MKILAKKLSNEHGYVKLIPENSEDMWYLYQLIQVGDSVKSTSYRKVVMNESSSNAQTVKVKTSICIAVESIESATDSLRLRGKNVQENEYVKLGSYHTITVEPNRTISIQKQTWDSVSRDLLKESTDLTKNADIAAIVMQEGIANLCLITPTMSVLIAHISLSIPRKRNGFATKNHDKALAKFFENILQSIVRHIDFSVVQVCILASPGFVKDQFFEYLKQTSNILACKDHAMKTIQDNKAKFLLCHCSSGFKHSVDEVLRDPAIMRRLTNTKAIESAKLIARFYELLAVEPAKALYGENHVKKAADAQAIEIVFVSDRFLRSGTPEHRRTIVDMMETIKRTGGMANIFSTLHQTGQQLDQLGGIAAILRYPMPEILEEDTDSSSDEE